jgi:2',3'-cyclic-nucleotide 2'-phosphodiesterase (5'-nucleotidase family)
MFKKSSTKKSTALLLATMLTTGLVTPYNSAVKAVSSTTDIQILATSDLHGKFLPYEYATNSVVQGSLAQVATFVKEQRAANPNTIVLDNGDTIQDNSEHLFLDNTKNPNGINPMILAMNEIGYDTWTFGNHEFNYGVDVLKNISSKFTGKTLSGNVFNKDGTPLAAPYTIVEKGGVKVGIIGMVTPNITRWDGPNLKDYKVTNPVEETKKAIAELKGKTDVIIAAIHAGEAGEYSEPGSGVTEIANACPELAAIVMGHAHKAISNRDINGVQIVEPKNAGNQVAKLNIKLTKDADGKYSVASKTDVTSSLIEVAPIGGTPIASDKALSDKLQPYHNIALADANTVVGKLVGGDLVPKDEITGIPTAQIQPTAMIQLINKVQMHYGQQIAPDKKKVDVAAAASFRGDANIKAGDIKKSDTSLIYKFDNTLYVLDMTGAQLKKYMEWSAKFYNTYTDGDLTVSFNSAIPGYNYDMFEGLTYKIDISKEPGKRVTDIKKADGTALADADVLRVAVNNYRASTQLSKPGTVFEAGDELPKIVAKSEDTMGDAGRIRDLIRTYIVDVKGGTITPELTKGWSITGTNWNAYNRTLAKELINKNVIKLAEYNPKTITYSDVKAAYAKRIDIVSFNDLHGTMAEEATGKNPGVAKMASVINSYKKDNPNTVVVSAGDSYQGSAMSNLLYGEPITEAMKNFGVAASAVGNHEFDWGTKYISKWAQDGGFDFLASNIYSKTTNAPVTWAKPYKMITQDGVKIGLIGLSTPETAFKTKPEIVADLEFKDPVTAANEWASKLKSGELPEGKADVVIALTHLGASQDSAGVITGEGADLANGAKNIDGIITAHTHMTVSGKVNNIPVVQGYYNGRSLAKLSIMLDSQGKLISIVPYVDSISANKAKIAEDSQVKAIYDKYYAKVSPILDEVAGVTDTELTHDRFSDEGTSILGQWVTDMMNKVAGTQIAITNGGGLRCPIPAGNITVGKMYEMMPFDNTLVKMELKGSDIKRVIENGIANSSIGWVQVGGIKVYYNKDAAFGNRITAMYLSNGTKVEMDKYYTVVTNDFMYTGGDKFDFTGAKNVVDTGLPIRDALVNELKSMNSTHLIVTKNQPLVASEAPVVETPAIEVPVVETPAVETPVVETPVVETPVVETPVVEAPVVEAPAVEEVVSTSNNLPKTGSIITNEGILSLGSLITLLGFAFYIQSNKKKKEDSAA